ncbi:glycosyltransferase family 2 protein [Catenuloplanes indicus]|uniref:Glycosyltransferase involved in cell wall biosynthesis n=1 Tax=Catenuloplanes indicus TaxID=137267 RepID=A0AAE3W522_9ACTN|nr:glycosyltransferase family 2 protein [Catenuloplanes indicus]MDQ0368864.1 glycosyltransferase involved in cell wall biosynthesis [Catenuloplanes indicus]
MPRLGIGLPVHNGERYLPSVLDCLRRQTYTDFEVTICDNASTDATARIVRAVAAEDPRFRYVRNETNIGAPGNFNRVFALSGAELYAWVAADDEYDPAYFQRCVELLDQRPDAIGAFTKVALIDEHGAPLGVPDELIRLDDPDPAVRFGDLASFRHSCFSVFGVYRRAAIARTRGLLPFWNADRVLLAELALQGPVVVYPAPLYRNRQHTSRLTSRAARRDIRDYTSEPAPRALTWYYAGHLWKAIQAADLDETQRRRLQRAFAGWTVQNPGKLARSAVRGALESARDLRPVRRGGAAISGGMGLSWATLELASALPSGLGF